MPDAYGLEEARFIQQKSNVSAVLATILALGYPGPPEGKIWTIIAADYYPDIAETKIVSWRLVSRAGTLFTIQNPQSVALNPLLNHFGLLTEGMEIKLYPGEYLNIARDSATAGSSMTANMRYIETDMPLYQYVEPQEALRIQKFRRAIVPGGVSPIGGGRPAGIGGGGAIVGGRGSVPRPK